MTDVTDAQRLRERMRTDLKTAMKARDAMVVSALRTTLAALDNAEAVDASDGPAIGDGPIAGAQAGVGSTEVPRRELAMSEVRAVLDVQVAERVSAAADYARLGRDAEAERLRGEAEVVQGYVALLATGGEAG